MLGAIVSTLLAAFVIGVLARWSVPGPDPMPIWMTTGFGLVGALIGNSLAFVLFGSGIDSGTAFSAWLFAVTRRACYRLLRMSVSIPDSSAEDADARLAHLRPQATRHPMTRPRAIRDLEGSPCAAAECRPR